MTHSSQPRKTTANLSESVHSLLNTYALSAGAAGPGEHLLPDFESQRSRRFADQLRGCI